MTHRSLALRPLVGGISLPRASDRSSGCSPGGVSGPLSSARGRAANLPAPCDRQRVPLPRSLASLLGIATSTSGHLSISSR